MKEPIISAVQALLLFAVLIGSAVLSGLLLGIIAATATVCWLECTKLLLRAIL